MLNERDRGKLFARANGHDPELLLAAVMQAYKQSPPSIPRCVGHYKEWLHACQSGPPATTSFDYSGPLTETVLLGTVASRVPQTKLHWNSAELKFTNSAPANDFVRQAYRNGWEVEGL